MKIKITQVIAIWNYYNKLLERDVPIPTMFDIKMTRNATVIGQVALKIRSMTDIQDLLDKEIELPLSPLLLSELPESVPAGFANAFQAIIEDYTFKPEQINVEDLLNGTNGQSTGKATKKAKSKD